MISQVFETISDIVNEFIDVLVSLFEKIVQLFWVAPSTGDTTGHLTTLGILGLVAVASGLVIWAFNFIRSLFKFRAVK